MLVGTWSYIHDDVLPDKKIQEIIYAARPELRYGPKKWSVVEVDGLRKSITLKVIQDDVVERDEERPARVSWHRVQWGRPVSHQTADSGRG
jgi:hypothetical protein